MCGKSAYCWKTMFTGRRFARTSVTSVPCMTMRPASGSSKPATMRSVVVLPHPLGPSSEKNSPSAISSDTSSTAFTPPKRLLTPTSPIAARIPTESIPLAQQRPERTRARTLRAAQERQPPPVLDRAQDRVVVVLGRRDDAAARGRPGDHGGDPSAGGAAAAALASVALVVGEE